MLSTASVPLAPIWIRDGYLPTHLFNPFLKNILLNTLNQKLFVILNQQLRSMNCIPPSPLHCCCRIGRAPKLPTFCFAQINISILCLQIDCVIIDNCLCIIIYILSTTCLLTYRYMIRKK